MATKANSNPVKHLRWSFFHDVVTGFRGKLRMLPNIAKQLLAKIVED